MHTIKNYILSHKIISGILLLIVIGGGYEIYKWKNPTATTPKYVIAEVKKGTLVSSVSGSGQVSASNQITLQSKASGNIISINATVGQELKEGDLIAQVDPHNAQIDLENANISLQKLTEPTDKTTLLQTQNSLAKAYDTGFNTVVNTFLDFPDIINGMHDLFYTSGGYLSDQKIQSLSDTSKANRNAAGVNYDAAKKMYDANIVSYQNTTRTSTTQSIQSLIDQTYNTVKTLNESIKDSKNAVEYINNQQATKNTNDETTADNNLISWTNKMNTDLSNLLSARTNIEELTSSLDKLQQGPDKYDLQSQQLSIQQKQQAYDDTSIRAPFDGVLAQLNVNKATTVSNGTNIGTFITKQKIAEVTLNEVDVAKVKVGQQATLTFDAIDGLSISGKVAEVDLVGTVTQGVVNYSVKINFDTQDDRVKSGMSVSAAIITEAKQDVITVPNSAVKIQNGTHYVDVVDKNTATTNSQGVNLSTTPTQQEVQVGISDDTSTEIISGLQEGDKIITKTVTATTATTATTKSTTPSLLGGGGNSVIRTGGR
ncbi:MAG: efflux RND transporter periplasmic adaptor subunit [bacterium]